VCSHHSGRFGSDTLGVDWEVSGEFGNVFSALLNVGADSLKACHFEYVFGGWCYPRTIGKGSDMLLCNVACAVMVEGVQ